MAQTRNAANPDSFNLQTLTNAGMAGVGMAACVANNADAVADEFVGIGGNIFCGALLAATDGDATAGVITCNYK